jgi:hypothetical protein
MQDFNREGGETHPRLSNPILDLAVAGLEAQLKAWQAFQVEGTHFVARRMRCNLEYLRAFGHCCDTESVGECQKAWLRDFQKDYAEEWGRIAATSFALGFGELSGFGSLLGQHVAKATSEARSATQPQQQPKPQSSLQAAA